MATNVVFSQSNYEDSPSTNTPINATNLNTTVQGVRDTVVRANARVPFDNIIAVEDAGAITQRGTYVADVVDVSNLNQSLTNTIGQITSSWCQNIIKGDAVKFGNVVHLNIAMIRTDGDLPPSNYAVAQIQIGRASCRERVASPV